MKPDHDWFFLSGADVFAPDVEAEAVVADVISVGAMEREFKFIFHGFLPGSGAGRPIGHGTADAFPWGGFFRGHEAVGPCVGDAFEGIDVVMYITAKLAIGCGNDGGICSCDERLVLPGLAGERE